MLCSGAMPWLAAALEPVPLVPNLSQVRRIYVEPLGRTESAEQMRDMIIAAIQNSKLFLITEDEEMADAKLRGSANDKIYTQDHISSDSIGLHANAGSGESLRSSTSGSSASHQTGGVWGAGNRGK